MFRKLLDQGRSTGDNIGALLRGVQRNRDRERTGTCAQPGNDPSAHEVQGRGIRTEEGRGRKTYTVLQRIQTAVLFQNDGRNRSYLKLPEGVEMVHAGRQHHRWTITADHTQSPSKKD